jgi:histidine triad (HIT) family protein
MTSMNDTIFNKIIRGEIPAIKIYEDDQCFSFLDINPVSKGHTLLVPKTGFGRIESVPDEVLGYLIQKAKTLVIAMKSGLGCDFVQIDIVGKDVPDHFHIHLIPRKETDNVELFPHVTYENDEKESIAEKIRSCIK